MTEPIAWLLRETKAGKVRILPAECLKSREAADRAAARKSNRRAKVEVVPVVEMVAVRRCIHEEPMGSKCRDCDREAREATA